jgi:hypothetical protein
MEAGRELDALVAEKVMGIKAYRVNQDMEVFTNRRQFLDKGDYWYTPSKDATHALPYYSTDIAAAWLVVEKMRGPDFRLNKDGDWVCCFGGTITFCGEGDTAPLAICLAALKAVSE